MPRYSAFALPATPGLTFGLMVVFLGDDLPSSLPALIWMPRSSSISANRRCWKYVL
jgi:hypothetical protein